MHKWLTGVSIAVAVSMLLVGCAEPETTNGSNAPVGSGSTETSTSQPLMSFRPVIGGHLLVTRDGASVVMADVELDRLRVFSASRVAHSYDVALPEKSWPTRVIEGHHGEFFVLLRGAGAIATVTGQTVKITEVCAEPRGLALEPASDQLTVACAGGEVVMLNGGEVSTTTKTSVEWRDVQFTATGLQGTSFRSAELISLEGMEVSRRVKTPPQKVDLSLGSTTLHQSQVAWRMIPVGSGTSARTLLIHQLHADSLTVDLPSMTPNGSSGGNPYGGGASIPGQMVGCGNSAVVTAISTVQNGVVTGVQRTNDVLPVDAAVSPDGTQLAVVGAGGSGLSIYPVSSLTSGATCVLATAGLTGLALNSVAWISPTKVAIVESLRGTPMLFDLATGTSKSFGSETARGSAAHGLFHLAPRGGAALACASCHPEGGEDGHTWVIDGQRRRTQTLSGGVMARAPFHWKGDLTTLNNLMTDTFSKRMGGGTLMPSQVTALGAWLDTIPAPKASRRLTDLELKAGVEAFQKGQCANCHLSNGTQEGPASDIGTGERVRAPSLKGLAARAPYLHTGELPDIRARVMGTLHPQHGALGELNAMEREELIGYLESL